MAYKSCEVKSSPNFSLSFWQNIWCCEKWGCVTLVSESGIRFTFINVCNKSALLSIWFNIKISCHIDGKIISFQTKQLKFDFWILNTWLCALRQTTYLSALSFFICGMGTKEVTPEMMAVRIKGDKSEEISWVFSTSSALSIRCLYYWHYCYYLFLQDVVH